MLAVPVLLVGVVSTSQRPLPLLALQNPKVEDPTP